MLQALMLQAKNDNFHKYFCLRANFKSRNKELVDLEIHGKQL